SRSGCSGPRRERRTRTPRTSSTSGRWRPRSRSTRCPRRRCSLSATTAKSVSCCRSTAGTPKRRSPGSPPQGSTPTRSRSSSSRTAPRRSTNPGTTSCAASRRRRTRSRRRRRGGEMATLTTSRLRERPAYKALEEHYEEIKDVHLRELFADDPGRGERLTAEALGIYFDYSKNRITAETIKLLAALAEESGLRDRIDAMFRGDKINVTENRAVLHVALRAPKGEQILVDETDVVPQVHEVLDRMSAFADRVRSGEWKGYTGKQIRNVI